MQPFVRISVGERENKAKQYAHTHQKQKANAKNNKKIQRPYLPFTPGPPGSNRIFKQ